MRILHTPHAYWPVQGGAEHYCRRVSEALVAAGHEVRVAVADVASPEAFYQYGVPPTGHPRHEARGGVDIVRLPLRPRLWRVGTWLPPGAGRRLERWERPRSWRRYRRALAAEVERFRPDVVMALPHLFPNVRALVELRRGGGPPLVLVPLLHEHDPAWPHEEMAAAAAVADAVVALTPHEARRLHEGYGVAAEAVFSCPGGVDLPVSLPPARPRPPQVLFLGRISPGKGIELLIEAMKQVWRARPDVRLVIAGSRTPHSTELEQLITALPHEERARVDWVIDIPEADKERLLAGSACLALPSRIESFGMVLLEAWAHATPVVALDTPVMRAVVDHGGDGLLAPPGDAAGLGAAVAALVGDPERAAAMGRRGRAKAENHTWDRVAACFASAYEHARRQP